MQSFHTTAKRIRVTDPEHPMTGQCGAIYGQRRRDDGAWVAMDNEPPQAACYFPAGDDRHHHILLFPEQCEPV